jgi:hypothetical protein
LHRHRLGPGRRRVDRKDRPIPKKEICCQGTSRQSALESEHVSKRNVDFVHQRTFAEFGLYSEIGDSRYPMDDE